jgi:hypothetical protein
MTSHSLPELALPERIESLISLSQLFGRILPVHVIDPATGACTCGGFVRRKGKTTDIPCHAGKHPNLWKWQLKASSDPQQIAKWAAKYPRGNWGLVCGETGDVIDVDTRADVDGRDSLRALEAEIGIDLMAIAVVVKTGNGIQLWFKHDPDGRLKTGAGIRPGIDIRGGHQGKGLGMAIAPGSVHPNGNTYQIVSRPENGLQPIPESLIQALYKNQQVNPNPNNSCNHSVCGGGGGGGGNHDGEQEFQLRNVELTEAQREDLETLKQMPTMFRYTCSMTRATSPRPFKQGRNSPSEYEGSISCYLAWGGWSKQEIMDYITVWRREHGLPAPVYYSRYAHTINSAMALVNTRRKHAGAKKESKGAWKHGRTRDRILGSIIETPRTPQQIAEYTGIVIGTVYVVIGRLRKDGMVIRDHHTYLCAPHAVPSYLQNIPDDAGENTGEELMTPEDAQVDLDYLEAEYKKYVLEREAEVEIVEEEIEVPVLPTPTPASVYIEPTLPDFDVELEPVLVVVAPAAPIREEDPFSRRAIAEYRDSMEAWKVKWKQENLARMREARKLPNYHSMACLKREANPDFSSRVPR